MRIEQLRLVESVLEQRAEISREGTRIGSQHEHCVNSSLNIAVSI